MFFVQRELEGVGFVGVDPLDDGGHDFTELREGGRRVSRRDSMGWGG